jgi:hypothetical protein
MLKPTFQQRPGFGIRIIMRDSVLPIFLIYASDVSIKEPLRNSKCFPSTWVANPVYTTDKRREVNRGKGTKFVF